MKINWKLRLKSYPFWVALFGLIGLIVADTELLEIGQYKEYVQAILLILVAGGVVSDSTTKGFGDSKQALNYKKPREG